MKRTAVPAALRAVLFAALLVFAAASAATAQATVDVETVVDEIEATGRSLERSVPAETGTAINRANAQGVAFVRLDNSAGDTELSGAAEEILAEMRSRNSQYGAVIVINNRAVFARGIGSSAAALTPDIQPVFGSDIGAGIDLYLDALGDEAAGGFSDATATGGGSASSGSGFPWLGLILLTAGAFFIFNIVRGRRKTKKVEAKTIEDDRQEIIEQLKANADRVIDLGDEVITAKDPELISIYEEASAAYQNVSNEIRNASTVAEVDLLDAQIDKAEWQFEVIEARLTGQTPPPFLDDDRDDDAPTAAPAPMPPPPSASPAERDAQLRRQGQPPRPLPRRNPRVRQPQQPQRRGGGLGSMLGGSFGRMAMSVLLSMLMGGRLGQPRTSRRTQRRRGGGYGGIQMPF